MKKNFALMVLALAACLFLTAGTARAIDLFGGDLVIHGKLSEQMLMRAHNTQTSVLEKYDYSIFNLRSTAKLEVMWHAYKGPEYELNFYTVLKEFYDAADHVDGGYKRYMEWGSGGGDHGIEELRNYNTFNDICREMYGEVNNPLFQVRLGKQIISWGETSFERMADVVNPVDQRGNLNPSYPDYAEIKRGLWMGRFFFTPPDQPMDMSYELLLIPDFQPNRQWPVGYHLTHGSAFNSLKEPNEMFLPYYRDSHSGIRMNNLEIGGRIRGFIAGWDWTVQFLHHRTDDPSMKTGQAIASGLPALLGKNFLGTGWPGRTQGIYKYAWQDTFGITFNRPIDMVIPIIPGTDFAMSGNILRFEGIWENNKHNARLDSTGMNVKNVSQDRFAACIRWDTKIYLPYITPWARNKYLTSGTQLFHEYMPDKKKIDKIYPWVTYTDAESHKRWTVLTQEFSYELWNGRILPGFYGAWYINQGGGYFGPALGFKPTFNWTFMVRYIDYVNLYKDLNKKDFWTFDITYEF